MWSQTVLCCRAWDHIVLVHYREVTEVCYYLANTCLCGYARHIVVIIILVVGGGGGIGVAAVAPFVVY